MHENNIFKLLFKQEIFTVPSYSPYLIDINPYIYQLLLMNGEYTVKSNVSKIVFQSFLDHWIYGKTPDINPLNISEYDQLSQEFDRMKDLIEIFTKLTTSISSTTLQNDNNKLKKIINKKSNLLTEINEKNHKIIEFLLQRNEIKILSKHLKDFRSDLSIACVIRNVEKVDLLTRKKVTQNNLTFFLKEEEKAAILYMPNQISGDIFIPRTIEDETTGEKYVITSFFEESFAGSKLKSINFSEDSGVLYFYPKIFFNSSIETITIPPSLVELKNDWCYHAIALNNIIVMPNNCHFSYFDNKFLLGKSDQNSDVYDTLHFARRDIEEATIPPFIKYISPSAFNTCRKLRKIQFSENSELISIESNSLSETSIENITIPSHVKSIGYNAFYFCYHLKKVEFLNDSELELIKNNAFQQTYIEYLSIPSSVTEFNERWCDGLSKLNKIKIMPNKNLFITSYNENLILEKSDKKSEIFDSILFANRDIKNVIIPPFIKYIKPMSFCDCRKLKSVEFANHSELLSIEKYSFYQSSLRSISIPKSVKIIDDSAFSICMRFNRINFHENAELSTIGGSVFSFTSIRCISIPFNVTTIESYAFSNCSSLKIIEIPENLKLKSTKKELFNNTRNVMIMIPAKMRNIYHLKISPCRI